MIGRALSAYQTCFLEELHSGSPDLTRWQLVYDTRAFTESHVTLDLQAVCQIIILQIRPSCLIQRCTNETHEQ